MVCALRLVLMLIVFSLPLAAQSVETPQAMLDGTARLAGVLNEVTELRHIAGSKTPVDRWRLLWLHLRISERVIAESLQVDATIAQIDNEIAQANEVHSFLSDKRDRTVSRANLLGVLVGGGMGATSSGLQLSSTLDKPAAAVGIGAGALSAGIALAGIHAQKGESEDFLFSSNMLAEFFDRPILPDSHYPETVWTFLDETAPTGPADVSRKTQLVQGWMRVKRIDSLGSTDKIARLTSEPSEGLKLSIDDFEDRAAMLQDVRARISFLKRDLGRLLASLPQVDASAMVGPEDPK
jgi:hypothetical protein